MAASFLLSITRNRKIGRRVILIVWHSVGSRHENDLVGSNETRGIRDVKIKELVCDIEMV